MGVGYAENMVLEWKYGRKVR